MNHLSLLALVGLFCFYSCTEKGKNPTPLSTGELTVVDTAAYQPLYIHPLLSTEEINAQNTSLGGYGQVMTPPMERSEARLLTSAYWVAEFYHDSYASKAQRIVGQGQWFRFNPDGTFIGGHWAKQTHSGVWYLIYDADKRYLTIDSNVDRLDARWDLQAIGNENDYMGWVRTTQFGPKTPKAVTVKMMKLSDVPTKKQFGVAE